MAYLIDGNNFIGYTSPHRLKDPQSKYNLVHKLLIFRRLRRSKVLLVFDGAPDPNLMTERLREKSFSVIYPSFGEKADTIIKEIISKQTDPKKFYVVSSDIEIKTFAKSKGAKVLNCKKFNQKLRSALKEYRKSLENKKKVAKLSPLEVNQWLEIFKDKK